MFSHVLGNYKMKSYLLILLIFCINLNYAQININTLQGKWVLSKIRTTPSDCDYKNFQSSDVLIDSLLKITVIENKIEIAKKTNYLPMHTEEFSYKIKSDSIISSLPKSEEQFTTVLKYIELNDNNIKPTNKKSKIWASNLRIIKVSNEFLTLEDYVFDRGSPLFNSSTQRYYFKKINLENEIILESSLEGIWYSQKMLNDFYSALPDTLFLTRDSVSVKSNNFDNHSKFHEYNQTLNFTIDLDDKDYYTFNSHCTNCLVNSGIYANLNWEINPTKNLIRLSNFEMSEWYSMKVINKNLQLIKIKK